MAFVVATYAFAAVFVCWLLYRIARACIYRNEHDCIAFRSFHEGEKHRRDLHKTA